MKWRSPAVWVGPALLVLLGGKIFLGGVFLKAEVPSMGVALAGEEKKDRASAEPGEVPEKLTPKALKEREAALRVKEQEIRKREEELIPLKKDVEEKLGELNELQLRLTDYAKTLATREEALKDTKMAHLVELYTSMDPAKAAAIMEKLKMETVVSILRHMKGKSAGQIIALLKPEMGAQVVEKLSQMR